MVKPSEKETKSERLQARATPTTLRLLNELAAKNNRTTSNMVEVLIFEAAKKEGIK